MVLARAWFYAQDTTAESQPERDGPALFVCGEKSTRGGKDKSVNGSREFGGIRNVSFGLGFQPSQGFLDQDRGFSRARFSDSAKETGVPGRTGRDNSCPGGDFGSQAEF